MNSIERVTNAIARNPVDRIPLGFYAVDCDTVEKVLGRPSIMRDKVEIQLSLWYGRRDEVAEKLKKDTVEFYRKIDCADIILAKEAQILPPKNYEPEFPEKLPDDNYRMKDGRIFKAVAEHNDVQCIHDPRPRKEYSVKDFEDVSEPKQPDPSQFEVFDHLVAQLGKDRYIASSAKLDIMPMIGGMEEGLMMYALQPEVIEASNRQTVAKERELDQFKIRPGTHGVLVENDMGGTNGPLISPDMFRELCFPYMKQRIESLKRYRSQVVLHCCGKAIPLIEMFIDAGVDCYQSLQTTAGMDVGILKGKFGSKLSFWGGVPVEELIAGTPDEVRKSVRYAIEKGAPGSGFILGPSHSIAKNTKYENFMAMLDEYVKLRDKI
ncbi:MAG TPA: hypothetical protein DCZ94_22205 [Lentisphaeria bacterium]|nr:MAG: hypothetical protein A2X48_13445 [Lentisphaerae bacterium GWF2_49_21]HBC89661.1 hypothetical protein [Lentisphaeria bacterium]